MAGPLASYEDSPEFFKVFLPTHSSTHMSIPGAFVNQLNEGLPKNAILKDVTGNSWHVGLERIDNYLCFKTGWELFARDNFLERGDFLIFKYCGNSMFHVKIFSINGCKKDNVDTDGIGHGHVKIKQEIDKGNVDAQTHITVAHARKRKIRDIEIEKSSGKRRCFIGKKKSSGDKVDTQVQKPPSTNTAFDGSKTPSLQALVRSSHVEGSSMSIPIIFARSYFVEMEQQKVKLGVGKRWWDLKLTHFPRPAEKYMLTGGWRAFARDNCLRTGDVCRFKMIQSNPLVMKVSITRRT